MHGCLLVPEITSIVCRFLFYDIDPEGRKGALAVAQTCRLLYEPAVDVIWRRIPSLKPLANCIPNSVIWQESADSESLSPLKLKDLTRCRALGSRVRALGKIIEITTTHHRPEEDLTESQYRILHLAMAGVTLLPKILEVNIIKPSSTTLTYAHLFTHNRIETLAMSISIRDKIPMFSLHFVSFLSGVDTRYPSLKQFTLCIDEAGTDPKTLDFIDDIICTLQWRGLKTLNLSADSSIDIIQNLCKHPSLTNVHIELFSGEDRTKLDQLVSGSLLPNVEGLTLHMPSLASHIDFLELLSGPRPIRILQLYAYKPQNSTSSRWEGLITGVEKHCHPDKLEVLVIDDRDEEKTDHHPSPFTVTLDHLQPLLAFRSFRRVHISTSGVLELDDAAIAAITTAWPMLDHLRLDGSDPLRISLLGLVAIAENCHHLTELIIKFDSPQTMTSKPGLKPRFGQKLKKLDVLSSPIYKPGPMTAFLADLFPGLCEIFWCHPINSEEDRLWRQVEDLLPTLIEVRSNEVARFEGRVSG